MTTESRTAATTSVRSAARMPSHRSCRSRSSRPLRRRERWSVLRPAPSGPATSAAVPPAASTADSTAAAIDRGASPRRAATTGRARAGRRRRMEPSGARGWSERHGWTGVELDGVEGRQRLAGWRRGHGRTSEAPIVLGRRGRCDGPHPTPDAERPLRIGCGAEPRGPAPHRTRVTVRRAVSWRRSRVPDCAFGPFPSAMAAREARAAEAATIAAAADRRGIERAVGPLGALGDDERPDLEVGQAPGRRRRPDRSCWRRRGSSRSSRPAA